MIVVSRGFTKDALTAASEAGILTISISDLEGTMESLLHYKLKDEQHKGWRIRDFSFGGPSKRETARRDAAVSKLIELAANDPISTHPEIEINKKGIFIRKLIKKQAVGWFDSEDEFFCYKQLLGSLNEVPLLLLLIHMSFWNRIDVFVTSY